MKEKEVKQAVREFMEQWGYGVVPRAVDVKNGEGSTSWCNEAIGGTVDDLFYRFDRINDDSCPIVGMGKSIPEYVIMEYKSSGLGSMELQRAAGQGLMYMLRSNVVVYLVLNEDDLQYFADIFDYLPFGIMTFDAKKEFSITQEPMRPLNIRQARRDNFFY